MLSITRTDSPDDDDRALERRLSLEIEAIPQVLAAAVWLEDRDRLRTAYLAVEAGTHTRTIRDAALDLIRTRDVRCTPDQVHIGVPDPERAGQADRATRSPAGRPDDALDALEVHRSENHVRCVVRLVSGGGRYEGEARELDTESGRARAAARATLAALETADGAIRLGLEGAIILQMFGRAYVFVSVEAATARDQQSLPGVVALERSTEEAAALATLRALKGWMDPIHDR